MHCCLCQAVDTKVIESRLLSDGKSVRRRRQCEVCSHRFTTYEKYVHQLPMVVKSDGRREAFNHDKLLGGLKKACQKRPVPTNAIEDIAHQLELSIMQKDVSEIESHQIGKFIMQELRELDNVAYVRFTSFYWNFEDIEDFISVLQKDKLATRQEDLNL